MENPENFDDGITQVVGVFKAEKKKIQNMTTKELAKWLHNNYEEFSRKSNWETQKKCQVEFEDLPEENKKVMMKMARRIHKFV